MINDQQASCQTNSLIISSMQRKSLTTTNLVNQITWQKCFQNDINIQLIHTVISRQTCAWKHTHTHMHAHKQHWRPTCHNATGNLDFVHVSHLFLFTTVLFTLLNLWNTYIKIKTREYWIQRNAFAEETNVAYSAAVARRTVDLGVTWHFEIQLTWNFFNWLSNLVGIFFLNSLQNFLIHFST